MFAFIVTHRVILFTRFCKLLTRVATLSGGSRASSASMARHLCEIDTVLELRARNPILKTHFSGWDHLAFFGFDNLWGPMCSTKRHNFRQAEDFLQLEKKFKHASYQNVWRHLAENFLRGPQIYIYRPRRGIQSFEGGILKLHTMVEILAKTPKLKIHFFLGS